MAEKNPGQFRPQFFPVQVPPLITQTLKGFTELWWQRMEIFVEQGTGSLGGFNNNNKRFCNPWPWGMREREYFRAREWLKWDGKFYAFVKEPDAQPSLFQPACISSLWSRAVGRLLEFRTRSFVQMSEACIWGTKPVELKKVCVCPFLFSYIICKWFPLFLLVPQMISHSSIDSCLIGIGLIWGLCDQVSK